MHPKLGVGIAMTTCVLASTCAAQSQLQIYGTVDLGIGLIATQPPGAPSAPIAKVRGVHNGGLQTSYIGFRGIEDLGGGYRARFQMESFVRADTGQFGRFDANQARGADPMWSRESFVALGGAFGEVRLGNNLSPTWIAMVQTSAMGANAVFSPGFRQLFNTSTRGLSEADTALVNSVKYLSPTAGGVSGSLAVQLAEGSGGTTYSADIGYRSGPLFMTAAISTVRHAAQPNPAGTRDQDMVLVGTTYDFGIVKAFGQYSTINNDRLASKDKVPHFGVVIPAGTGRFQLAHAQDATTRASVTTKRTTTSAGYIHALSKRTELYGFLMRDKVSVGTADSWIVGVRHQF